MDKISISWNSSGTKIENTLDITAFMLNKNGECKNSDSVVWYSKTKNDGLRYSANFSLGANHRSTICEYITFDQDNIPFWCKEIVYVVNFYKDHINKIKFNELEFFEVYFNDELIYTQQLSSDSNKSCFYIGNHFKTGDNEYTFKPELIYLDKSLVQVCQEYGIVLIHDKE